MVDLCLFCGFVLQLVVLFPDVDSLMVCGVWVIGLRFCLVGLMYFADGVVIVCYGCGYLLALVVL